MNDRDRTRADKDGAGPPPHLAAIAADFVDDSDFGPLTLTHGAPVWRWTSGNTDKAAAWFFLTIDGEAGQRIAAASGVRGGFGSVRVEACIGATSWRTSLFPSREAKGFLLPVKAAVRRAEGLVEGKLAIVRLSLL